MIIVNKQTLEVYDSEELRTHPSYRHNIWDFSDPEMLDEVLAENGLAVLQMPNQPMFDSRYQKVECGDVVENDGVYSAEWVLSYLELDFNARAELIADKRFSVETGGVNVFGTDIPTDRHTQQVLTAMYVRAMADSGYAVKFKTSNGFVDLVASQIIAIAGAVHDHVQAAFDREGELLARLEGGENITPDDWE